MSTVAPSLPGAPRLNVSPVRNGDRFESFVSPNEVGTIALRRGNDLVVFHSTGAQTVLRGFFLAEDVAIAFGANASAATTITEQSTGEVVGADQSLIYARGTPDVLQAMAGSDAALSSLVSSGSYAVAGGGASMPALLGGLALAAAAGGGGGGGAAAGIAAPADTPPAITSAPSVVITGSGAVASPSSGSNTITFTFNQDIDASSFTEADIRVSNGTLTAGSLTQVDSKTWTATVVPDLAEGHTNVLVSLVANAVTNAAGLNSAATSNVPTVASLFASVTTPSASITGWDVSTATSMASMFESNTAFNQAIGVWDVGNVANMSSMFKGATSFNQNLSAWSVSKLATAQDLFTGSGMSVANMDATLNGWATVDTGSGETTLQSGVALGVANYSDATAVQYLATTFGWTVQGGVLTGATAGGNTADDTIDNSAETTVQKIHGLGGDDTLTGGSAADLIWGGAGADTLTGGAGADTFFFSFENAGADTVTDFTNGAGGDAIDVSGLLIGYVAGTSTVTDFVTAAASGSDTVLTLDHDGAGASSSSVAVTLTGITFASTLVADMLANGNLVMA